MDSLLAPAVPPTTGLVEHAASIERIRGPVDYEIATDVLRAAAALRARIDETFAEPIARAHASHKAMIAARDKHRAPVVAVETRLRGLIADYVAEERARVRAAELEAAEERARRERAAAEERSRRQAEAQYPGGAEPPPPSPAEPPPADAPLPAAPVADGISVRARWEVAVHDIRALAGAVAAGTVPPEAVKADLAVLRRIAQATSGTVAVPGVVFTRGATVQVRA